MIAGITNVVGESTGDTIDFMQARGGLTYADLAAFPEDNVRREIIGGELIVSPSPIVRHQIVLTRLCMAVGNYLNAHGGGIVLAAPMDVLLAEHDIVQPDLVVITDDRSDIITRANIKGTPTLLIEIISPSNPRLDRVRKRDLYARVGVPEFWIVDPDADRVEVYRHDGSGYSKPEILEPGDSLRTTHLPGFELDLTALFAR